MTPAHYAAGYKSSWALVVGINNYQHISPLTYACNDADAVAEILQNELGFASPNIVLLKDDSASKSEILDAYLGLHEQANDPDDRVLVFFAGHGHTIPGLRGPIGYLVPVDGNPQNPNSLIRWDELTRNADLIAAKHILFIMDACYSGLIIQRAIQPGTQRFVSDMLQRLSRQVITAGKADETVADGGGPEGNNSIFTGYLLEGLRGEAANKDGVLTANALMSYVYQKVGQDSRSQQTPHYGHIDGDGDFVFWTPEGEYLRAEAQTDYLVETVEEMPEPLPVVVTPVASPSFSEQNGYGDIKYPSFGRNDWTKRLGEFQRGGSEPEITKAFSWLSLVAEPTVDQSISMDLANEGERLSKYQPPDDAPPEEKFKLPRKVMTTINSIIVFDEYSRNREIWWRYLRMEKTGNIEYADTENVLREYRGVRLFKYVQMIGLIWQFMHLTKSLLANAGYSAGVRFLVNLIGTRDTLLSDFSRETGKGRQKWLNPFEPAAADSLHKLRCPDTNLQMEYKFVLGNLDKEETEKIIRDIAQQFSLAYNHQSQPRCFTFGTETFPWDQYLYDSQFVM